MNNPIVFVSYSHDTALHKEWVLAFSSDLRLNGVDVILDQWDLKPGQDIVQFMHAGLARADRVLIICSENYVQKADSGTGGVGYEKLIVSAELAAKTDTIKFIPIVRNNRQTQKQPLFMGARLYLDFDVDELYEIRLKECLRELHGLPQKEKPKLGAFAVPQLMDNRSTDPSTIHRPSLIPRELEALRWTMDGKTSWEVGAILGVTEETAKTYISGAMQKLGSTSKHQAVLRALRLGLIK